MVRAGQWCAFCAVVACLFPLHTGWGQTDVPNKAEVVAKIRKLYYKPWNAGLQSFSCDVRPEWRGVIEHATGVTIPEDDSRLLYLNQVGISFTALADGEVHVELIKPSEMLRVNPAKMNLMMNGAKEMVHAVLVEWLKYLDGGFMPRPNEGFILERSDEGYFLTLTNGRKVGRENFSLNYVLKETRIIEGGKNTDSLPIFTKTKAGLMLTWLKMTSGFPDKSPIGFVLFPEYRDIDSYELPSGFSVVLAKSGLFSYSFFNCRLNGDASASGAPAKAN